MGFNIRSCCCCTDNSGYQSPVSCNPQLGWGRNILHLKIRSGLLRRIGYYPPAGDILLAWLGGE